MIGFGLPLASIMKAYPVRSPLTPTILSRELCRVISSAQWELRGAEDWTATAYFRCYPEDLRLSLDDFDERFLIPVWKGIFTSRIFGKFEWGHYGIWASRETFRGVTVQLEQKFTGTFEIEFTVHVSYRAPHPDHAMPVYFWLGRQAEAA